MRPRSSGFTGAAAMGSRAAGMAIARYVPRRTSALSPISQIASIASLPGIEQREIVGVGRLDHQQPRAAVRQDVLKLRPARRDVDRHRDRAEPGAAEHDLEKLDAVGADDRDAVALLDAGRVQRAGEARRGVAGVRVGPGRLAGADQRRCRVALGLTRQHRRQGALGRRERLPTNWPVSSDADVPLPCINSPCRRDSSRSPAGRG